MFSKLTEPKKGWSFWVLNLLVDVNYARTWTWDDQTDDRMQRTTHYFSVHLVRRIYVDAQAHEGSARKIQKALTIIIGPLKIMLGLAA